MITGNRRTFSKKSKKEYRLCTFPGASFTVLGNTCRLLNFKAEEAMRGIHVVEVPFASKKEIG